MIDAGAKLHMSSGSATTPRRATAPEGDSNGSAAALGTSSSLPELTDTVEDATSSVGPQDEMRRASHAQASASSKHRTASQQPAFASAHRDYMHALEQEVRPPVQNFCCALLCDTFAA